MITDQEYPVRPAFSLLQKVLDEFTTAVPKTGYSNPSSISFPQLQAYLEKYQDPKQADAIMRVQQELDETKIILVRHYPNPPSIPLLMVRCSTGCAAQDN